MPAAGRIASVSELPTPHGSARVHVEAAASRGAALVLGHGASGGVSAPDILAVGLVARELGMTVVRVEQPYRVAGRRSPAPARQLDAAWLAVIEQLRDAGTLPAADATEGLVIVGGRSSGARVACRTALAAGAQAVLCLAFPLHPPGRAGDPEKSRLPELDAVPLPMLVIQGERDPFGMPPPGPDRTIATVAGTHSLRSSAAVGAAARPWLSPLLGGR